MADAIATIVDEVVEVTIYGAELLAPLLAQAGQAVTDAEAQVALAGEEADRAEDAAADAQAAITLTSEVRQTALVQGVLPIGWVDPNEYTNVAWLNPLGIKFFSNGLKVWPMLPDAAATLAGWRAAGAPRQKFEDDGTIWVGVSLARFHDPTTSGSVTQLYVNVNTGNNANDGLTIGAPKKTVESAIAAVNAGSAGTYQINLITTDFIPSNGEGWNAELYINAGRKVKIYAVPRADGSKPWWLPGMRRSGYAKADFAWSDIGDGWWKSTAVGISAAAKNTSIVFDLSVLDADGAPTPGEALTGTLADDAAVKAAADGRPAFYYRAGDGAFYVKLASGDEPDPGINFAYVEVATSAQILIADTGRFMVEGLRVVNNAASSYGEHFQLRPQTLYLGASNPVYNHDIHAIFKGVELYGASGNALVFFDCDRAVVEDCTDAYTYLDGVNQSTFYTPGNSNGTDEGSAQHCFVDGHLSLYHGPAGFKSQLTANTSSNTFTSHSRCNMTILNSRGGFSNGSGVAIVGGAKCLAINVNSFGPKYVTPSEDVYPAAFLASGRSAYDVNIKSEIWAIHCTGMTRPNGRIFYVGPTARIVSVSFRGTITKQVDSGGVLQDGFGGSL